jgi:hypothetical protein
MGRPRLVAGCSQPVASLRHHEPALEKHLKRLVRGCVEASPVSTGTSAGRARTALDDTDRRD